MPDNNISATRVTKQLGGLEDLAVGRDVMHQVRGGQTVSITKVPLIYFADSINSTDLSTLNVNQFTRVHFTGTDTIADGGQGIFTYDPLDTSSPAGTNVIVDTSGRRWKRT